MLFTQMKGMATLFSSLREVLYWHDRVMAAVLNKCLLKKYTCDQEQIYKLGCLVKNCCNDINAFYIFQDKIK